MILCRHKIDVLLLQEVDIRFGEVLPMIEGYESFHHTSSAGVIRVVTYVKSHLAANQLVWDQDMPLVIIKLNNVTIINFYNEFTFFCYTNKKTKMTKRQQLERVKKLIEITFVLGNRICWAGDANLDLINSPLARAFINFCDDYGIRIENWAATCHKARLDQILNWRSSIHSIQNLDSYVSDHSMIIFKLGKKTSYQSSVSKVKIVPDQILACWSSTPLSFIQMDQDIEFLNSEIRDINQKAYKLITKTKRTKQPSWYFHPKLVELRNQIRMAEPLLRKKLQNKYINHSRRIKVESEPMPINVVWNLMRKKDKPLTIELNGQQCSDDKLIAEKFAEHMSEQEFQPVASEPQPSQNLSSQYWKFKFVTPEDVRKRIEAQKPKMSVDQMVYPQPS